MDAAFEHDTHGPKLRLCALTSADGHSEAVITHVPPEVIDCFDDRLTQIAMGELMGVLLAFAYFHKLLKNRSAIIFGDNMGVIATIVNGGSKYRDLGTMSHLLHCRIAALHTVGWFEYVESWSNPADGGTREELEDPVTKRLGIPMRRVPPLTIPTSFPWMTPQEGTAFWEKNSPDSS